MCLEAELVEEPAVLALLEAALEGSLHLLLLGAGDTLANLLLGVDNLGELSDIIGVAVKKKQKLTTVP